MAVAVDDESIRTSLIRRLRACDVHALGFASAELQGRMCPDADAVASCLRKPFGPDALLTRARPPLEAKRDAVGHSGGL